MDKWPPNRSSSCCSLLLVVANVGGDRIYEQSNALQRVRHICPLLFEKKLFFSGLNVNHSTDHQDGTPPSHPPSLASPVHMAV